MMKRVAVLLPLWLATAEGSLLLRQPGSDGPLPLPRVNMVCPVGHTQTALAPPLAIVTVLSYGKDREHFVQSIIAARSRYAARHGYAFCYTRDRVANYPPHWVKLPLMRQALEQVSPAVYLLDGDAIVTDESVPLLDLVAALDPSARRSLVFSRDYYDDQVEEKIVIRQDSLYRGILHFTNEQTLAQGGAYKTNGRYEDADLVTPLCSGSFLARRTPFVMQMLHDVFHKYKGAREKVLHDADGEVVPAAFEDQLAIEWHRHDHASAWELEVVIADDSALGEVSDTPKGLIWHASSGNSKESKFHALEKQLDLQAKRSMMSQMTTEGKTEGKTVVLTSTAPTATMAVVDSLRAHPLSASTAADMDTHIPGIDRAFVLHYTPLTARRASLTKELALAGVGATWLDVFDKQHMPVSAMDLLYPSLSSAGREASGAQANVWAQMTVMAHMLHQGWDNVLILEDDAQFLLPLDHLRTAVADALTCAKRTERFDMLFLSARDTGYIISKEGARRVLDSLASHKEMPPAFDLFLEFGTQETRGADLMKECKQWAGVPNPMQELCVGVESMSSVSAFSPHAWRATAGGALRVLHTPDMLWDDGKTGSWEKTADAQDSSAPLNLATWTMRQEQLQRLAMSSSSPSQCVVAGLGPGALH